MKVKSLSILVITLLLFQLVIPFTLSAVSGEDDYLKVSFTNPTGGEQWTSGSSHNISWDVNTTFDLGNISVYIEYAYDGLGPYEIATFAANETFNHTWEAPSIDTDNVYLLIRVEHGEQRAWDFVQIKIDSTSPELLDHHPSQGDVIFSTERVELVFDQPVNMDDVSANFTLMRGETVIAGSFRTSTVNDNFTVTFSPTQRLQAGTDYNWRLEGVIRDTSDPGNALQLNLSVDFEVEEGAPKVNVITPERDLLVLTEETLFINWTTDDTDLDDNPVDISISIDGGENWFTVVSGIDNTGNHTWTVEKMPLADYPVKNALINVSCRSISGYMGYGYSQPFLLYDNFLPELEIIRPYEGTNVVLGYTYLIQWTVTDDNPLPNRPITISVTTDLENKTWRVIAQSIGDTGEYEWTVDGLAGQAVINVSCKDSHGDVNWTHSPSFTVLEENPLSISISPDNKSFYSRQRVNISWETPTWVPGIQRLRLLYSAGDGIWRTQADMESEVNYMEMSLPYEITSNFSYRLEMYDWDGVLFYVESREIEVFPKILESDVEHIGDFTFVTIRFDGYVALGHMQSIFTLYRDGERVDVSINDIYQRHSSITVYIARDLEPGEYRVELDSEGLDNRDFTTRQITTFTISEEPETQVTYWPLLLFIPLAVITISLFRGKGKQAKLPNTHVKIQR